MFHPSQASINPKYRTTKHYIINMESSSNANKSLPDTSTPSDTFPGAQPKSNSQFKNGEKSATMGSSSSDEQSISERSIRGFRWTLVCIAIFSANILYGLDTTIVADIQGAVSGTFDNVTQLGWLGVGFTLGSTVFILPLGKAYSTFDNKWIFLACLINFAAASALCGAAPNMNAVIIGRVWAGAGGAGMYLGTLNLSTAISLPHEQAFYVGVTGFVYGSGCILGPVVGGLLADSAATWRWAFYLNLVIFAVMSPVYIFVLPSVPQKQQLTITEKVKTLDWLGIALNTGVYCTFTIAFTFGGVIWPWNDGRLIGLIVVFGVLIILFVVTQYFSMFTTPTNRIFPCELLRDRQLILLYIIMACGGASLFVSVYYIPLYFLFVHEETGTEAAVRLLPFICFYVATILICGAYMDKVGYHSVWFLLSGMCLTSGAAAMYTVKATTRTSNIAGYTMLVGLGMATTQAGYAVGNTLVGPARAAELIQFLNISQGSSQLIGLAIASTVFQTETFKRLKQILGPKYNDSEIEGAMAGTQSALLREVDSETRTACIVAIVQGISKCWILIITAGALYTVCSCLLTRARFVKPRGNLTQSAIV
jgi:MFS family permease